MENANLFMEIGPENSKRIVWMIPNETAQMNDLACMKMTPPPVASRALRQVGQRVPEAPAWFSRLGSDGRARRSPNSPGNSAASTGDCRRITRR